MPSQTPVVLRLALAATLTAGLTAAVLSPAAARSGAEDGRPVVQQVGTFTRLVQPDFSGVAPLSEAIDGQTLGLGTFDDLDGEFVLVGGTAYRIGTDGTPREVDPARTTPWVQAVDFRPDSSAAVPPGMTCEQLASYIPTVAGASSGIVAVRVRGTFSDVVMRSVPAQTRPFPSLSTVVANQTVFPLGSRRAVLVGFLQGDAMQGIGQPGLHLHGVTADRTAGGHVLSCVVGSDVQLSVQRTSGVEVHGH
jgi:acetolactate decarboxylase